MNSRGFSNVQSDPSLRGAGFEQVLILVDGIRVNDPQTGHHNMNIPVTLMDVERIEVLRGQGSTLYGPDAFGGVINIITRDKQKKTVSTSFGGGSFDTYFGTVNFSSGLLGVRSQLSMDHRQSGGYRENTDFSKDILRWRLAREGKNYRIVYNTGLLKNAFGANDFYVKDFDSREEISSVLSGIQTEIVLSPVCKVTASVGYRLHKDHFILSKSRPEIYSAQHTSQRFSAEGRVHLQSKRFGSGTFGIEAVSEDINSNTLGLHSNLRVSFFGEGGYTTEHTILKSGLRADLHSVWGLQINPSLSAAYIFNNNLLAKFSVGRAFRAPTFIELYNPSPTNIGNSGLVPERALSADMGVEYAFHRIQGSSVLYFRRQTETIDWVKNSLQDPWKAENIFTLLSRGIEQDINVILSPGFSSRFIYTYHHQSHQASRLISKYALVYPKQQLQISLSYNSKTSSLAFTPVFTYKQQPILGSYIILDTQISFQIHSFNIALSLMNLTGFSYTQIRDVPMPGRNFALTIGSQY